jgi:hypothetical protein
MVHTVEVPAELLARLFIRERRDTDTDFISWRIDRQEEGKPKHMVHV